MPGSCCICPVLLPCSGAFYRGCHAGPLCCSLTGSDCQAAAVLGLSCCQSHRLWRAALQKYAWAAEQHQHHVLCSASLPPACDCVMFVITSREVTLCCLAPWIFMKPGSCCTPLCCQPCVLHRIRNCRAARDDDTLKSALHVAGAARSRGDRIPARASSLCHSLASGAISATTPLSLSRDVWCSMLVKGLLDPACALQSSWRSSWSTSLLKSPLSLLLPLAAAIDVSAAEG